MLVEQYTWTASTQWQPQPPGTLPGAQWVLVFAGPEMLDSRTRALQEIREAYPEAQIVGCTTAGEIRNTQILDHSLVVTAIEFQHSQVLCRQTPIDTQQSFQAGERLRQAFDLEGLRHLFVLAEGVDVNGSQLVAGLTRDLPAHINVTGGLSGDGERMTSTRILCNGEVASHRAVAVGLYGDRLEIGQGSLGGWDAFGPERLITRSEGNVLYQLDGQSALELYKTYLGHHADDLPAAGLLFPLTLRLGQTDGVVRTILGVDEASQSLIFAGDVPEGAYVRLMKANFNRLLDGAVGAAEVAADGLSDSSDLAILISCIGRRMILKQRTEEEVEAVREVLGPHPILTGFYSYGEISPFAPNAKCELHNQTMTITTLREH